MEDLSQFCNTERQKEVIEAYQRTGSYAGAARELGIARRSVNEAVLNIKARANKYHSPGFSKIGESTLYNAEGEEIIKWVKTKADPIQEQELVESIKETFQDYKGTAPLIKPLRNYNKDLLNLLPLGDPHIGMYAWAAECGEDFDCDIAEADLVAACGQLFSVMPKAETCIILNLGDFFHSDNAANTTTRGTPVDVDGRWGRVLQIGVRIMITCVEMALQTHKTVIVKNMIGNHDTHTSQVLAIALDCFFSKNKRVQIDTSPAKFWYYKFGKCLFASTHGDTTKPANLPLILANDKPEWWAETNYRYWHTGHIHHDTVKEMVGCKLESHRTLAARDAWHTAQGYRSQRDMKAITYHKDFGVRVFELCVCGTDVFWVENHRNIT